MAGCLTLLISGDCVIDMPDLDGFVDINLNDNNNCTSDSLSNGWFLFRILKSFHFLKL